MISNQKMATSGVFFFCLAVSRGHDHVFVRFSRLVSCKTAEDFILGSPPASLACRVSHFPIILRCPLPPS